MFIGSSFVFKKKGLLQSTEKTGNDWLFKVSFISFYIGGVAGEGYSYLKSTMWWSGMILSKLDEIKEREFNWINYVYNSGGGWSM